MFRCNLIVCIGMSSLVKLIVLNLAACGFELSLTAVTTIAPPMLRRHSFTESMMGRVLAIGPLLGLFTVPLLGRWSDCAGRDRSGCRKPFIAALGAISVGGCLAVANHRRIADVTNSISAESVLVFGVCICMWSAHVVFTPYQSLISELCEGEQAVRGAFVTFTMAINLGAITSAIAFSWSWFNVSTVDAESTTMNVLALVVTSLVCCTLFGIRETRSNPGSTKNFIKNKAVTDLNANPSLEPIVRNTVVPQTSRSVSLPKTWRSAAKPNRIERNMLRSALTLLGQPFQLPQRIRSCSAAVRKLFITDLLAWTSLMCFYLFITDYLGQAFGGRAEAKEGSEARSLFDEGVRVGARCLLINSISSGLFSLILLPALMERLGKKRVFMHCLLVNSLCMIGLVSCSTTGALYILSAIMGCGYSVVGAVPNIFLTMYFHWSETTGKTSPAVPSIGLAENFSLLDISYCLSAILPAAVLGVLVEQLQLPAIYPLTGGVVGLLAAASATQLVETAAHQNPNSFGDQLIV